MANYHDLYRPSDTVCNRPLPPPPPPPPHRSDGSLMPGNKEEGNTEMVRTRPFYYRRCKRKKLTNIESLPDDLLFQILLHLSVQDIYVPARLVCRKWYRMIHTHNFTYAYLQHTTSGLLFSCWGYVPFFVALRRGQIEISTFSYQFTWPLEASCNGLVLQYAIHNIYSVDVINPATNQSFILPPLYKPVNNANFCSMAYASASMEYKAVMAYLDTSKNYLDCAILTVGVDYSWRKVRTEHLSFRDRTLLVRTPLITEGFLHWANNGNQVLTLNVETEVITKTLAPIPQVYGGGNKKYYLSTGSYLSLLITCRKFLWEVWEMNSETGEWRKLPNIAFEAQECAFGRFDLNRDDYLVPVGWFKYLEVLAFATSGDACIFMSYNLLTQEIDLIQPPSFYSTSSRCVPPSRCYKVVVHKNSLEWLGGCKI